MTIYLRPLGLFKPPGSLPESTALPLSNTGLAFPLVEVISRKEKIIQSSVLPVDDARKDKNLAGLLQAFIKPRAPFAGLTLDQTRIMGVLNVTPDSFSDGGLYVDPAIAASHAHGMMSAGADIIDIGGESTRPKAVQPSLGDELNRVLPVIQSTGKNILMSVDTRRAAVMQKAVQVGAAIINDVSALTHDPASVDFIARNKIPVILMHIQGNPETMQDNPQYDHAALDVYDYLAARVAALEQAGLPRSHMMIDPGIGFGKTLEHNRQILSHLSIYHGLGCGVMVGLSRKAMIGKITGVEAAADRMAGSVSGALYAVSQGVQMVRVHDVKATREALRVWDFCCAAVA